ncbi:MAG: DUF501 domain-containing protein [Candidatus Wallbacteria bacterium]
MSNDKLIISLNYSDFAAACYQFEKPAVNFIGVSARCKFNNPAAFMQDPFQTKDYVFPTLFYLSCPRVVKCVSKLENNGFLGELKCMVTPEKTAPALYSERYERLISLYQYYIKKIIEDKYIHGDRFLIKNYDVFWNNCPIDKKINTDNLISERIDGVKYEQYLKLLKSGIGGSSYTLAVKCLHALYAFLVSASCDAGLKTHENYEEVIFFKNIIDSKLKLDTEFESIF